jgi:hypothetical protein
MRPDLGRLAAIAEILQVGPILGHEHDLRANLARLSCGRSGALGSSGAKTREACHRAALCADPLALLPERIPVRIILKCERVMLGVAI